MHFEEEEDEFSRTGARNAASPTQSSGGLFEKDDRSRSREALLWKLSRRDLSAKEAADWLLSKGYAPEVAEQAVEAAKEWRAIDEQRLLGAVIRSEIRKGRGPSAVRNRLKLRGLSVVESMWRALYDAELLDAHGPGAGWGAVPPEATDAKVPNAESADRDRALALVARRYPAFRTDPAERKKAFQFLVRRGFPISRVGDWLRP